VWRMNREHHAGLIVKSARAERVRELLDSYAGRFEQDFLAYAPPKEMPAS